MAYCRLHKKERKRIKTRKGRHCASGKAMCTGQGWLASMEITYEEEFHQKLDMEKL